MRGQARWSPLKPPSGPSASEEIGLLLLPPKPQTKDMENSGLWSTWQAFSMNSPQSRYCTAVAWARWLGHVPSTCSGAQKGQLYPNCSLHRGLPDCIDCFNCYVQAVTGNIVTLCLPLGPYGRLSWLRPDCHLLVM